MCFRTLLIALFAISLSAENVKIRVDASDDLTIQFKHKTKNTVRSRMLRSEVDRKVAKLFGLLVHVQTFGPAFSSPGRTG